MLNTYHSHLLKRQINQHEGLHNELVIGLIAPKCVVNESDHQPNKQKRFWSFIKSLRKDSSGVAPLKENGKMHADPKDKTNILNRQYESVYTKEDTNNVPSPSGQPYQPMEEITVTEHGSALTSTQDQPTESMWTRHDLCQDTQGLSC